MYRRIEELAEGKVHTAIPLISFTPEQVMIEQVEGIKSSGSFTIESMNNLSVRGVVYSTDLRMEIKNPQFQGENPQIHYEFHGDYMQEGDVATGDFLVISSGGEYNLSWSVAVKRLYAETSIGRITKLEDFIRLYRVSWRESIHVFGAPAFKKLLKTSGEQLFYKLMSTKPVLRANIEEFLVGCKRKPRVFFSLSASHAECLQLSEPVEESLTISLSDWGYVEMDVSCDAGFVSLEKDQITGDDFNGDHFQFRYQLYPERMHAGKNFASITFSNHLQQETYEITASLSTVLDLERDDRRRKSMDDLKLLRSYEKFLAGELVLGEWAKQTTELLRARREQNENSDMDALWCAYAWLQNRQKQEAAWILDEYRHSRSADDSREWAFFLYLCSLTESEPKLLDKLYQKLREIYRANHEDVWMRFLIMQIADRSPEVSPRQLKLMEQWFMQGMASPFLYARAADIYEKEPYLLLSIGKFELHVLKWICRHGRLTRDLTEQIVRRAISVKSYTWMLDEILVTCYNTYPETEMLAGLCAYRIKGERFGKDAHAYYELAIEHDLQITGLYEAFMASLDAREVRQLPKSVQLYFQYSNRLTWRQKAVLYVNIISNREAQPAVYERYRQIMQDFAQAQMLEGHMDDNLAVVYAHVLERMPLNEELAHALSRILYVNKFTCLEETVTHVIIQQENLKQPRVYPLTEHQAYFPVYAGDYVILLQDAHGRRFALSSETQMERLMNPGKYIRKCLELAPEELPYVLHHMNGKTRLLHMDVRMAGFARTLVRSEAVSDDFKSKISPGFLEYCRGEGFTGDTRDYILKIDFGRLPQRAKDRYLESLVQLQMYQEAWTFLVQYGVGKLSGECLQQVVLAQLQAQQMQEDEHLLYFCGQCFLMESVKRPILEYLCSYYQGPAVRMVEIWREAIKQQVPAVELEERLLIQMVFSSAFTPDVQKVFADYCAHQGREQVRMAYLTYFSYEIFVNRLEVERELYPYLEQATLGNRRANQYLRFALFEHYTNLDVLTVEQNRFVDDMLNEYIGKGQYFSCFLNLPGKQQVRYHLYDLCVVEYRSSVQGSEVWLNYRISAPGGDFKRVQLKPALAGIYLWSMRLAGDEQLEYYISEKSERMETITESHLAKLSAGSQKMRNRYTCLNEMIDCARSGDARQLQMQMGRYQAYDGLTARLFRVL